MTELWFTTARLTIHLSMSSNADGISLIEHWMARDFAVPLHLHEGEDESFYVLQGEIRMQIGNEIRTLLSGDAVTVPGGVSHSFRIVSEEGRFLTITTGSFENMVRDMARPAMTDGLPPQDPPTQAQIDDLIAACTRHGIEFVGPPVA